MKNIIDNEIDLVFQTGDFAQSSSEHRSVWYHIYGIGNESNTSIDKRCLYTTNVAANCGASIGSLIVWWSSTVSIPLTGVVHPKELISASIFRGPASTSEMSKFNEIDCIGGAVRHISKFNSTIHETHPGMSSGVI